MRWIERLQKFNFIVKYKKGSMLHGADALSRSVFRIKKGEEAMEDIDDKILRYHYTMNHRKAIKDDLEKETNLKFSKNKIRNVLKRCLTCKKKEKQVNKTCKFIETFYPGERIGIDLLEVTKNVWVIVAIDYYTRKIFAKNIKSKNPKKIIKFLEYLKSEIKIVTLISDNGREFSNKEVENWCKNNGITHLFSIPYYHQSNGRVERANKTLREALKKTPGVLKIKLKQIVSNYNNLTHRGIGMTPN